MPTTNLIFLVLPKVHLLDLAGADQVFMKPSIMASTSQFLTVRTVQRYKPLPTLA